MKPFHVQADPAGRDLKEQFGITGERCVELCGLCDEIIAKNKGIAVADLSEQVSKHCENANEVMFMGIVIGRKVEEQNNFMGLIAKMHESMRPSFTGFSKHSYN
jgi:hypothetical protein